MMNVKVMSKNIKGTRRSDGQHFVNLESLRAELRNDLLSNDEPTVRTYLQLLIHQLGQYAGE